MTGTGDVRWLDDGEQHSWRALMMGMTLLLERLDDDLRREFGMSLTEYEVMVRLSERPGRAMRMAQLADAMAHSRSRVTHTVARMEAAGYVTRGTTPEDGRGVVATMTEQGYELLVKAAPCHVESVRRNLVDLVPGADFAAVGRVFDAVADHLVTRHPESEIRTS
jgi:DNA-binding MarR family transcriptional regulator